MANTSKRGFASMDPSKQREIASKGGRAAHAKGTAHEFTSDEARVAGRKGGEAVSRDRAHMSAIGREGGHSRGTRSRQGGNDSTSAARQEPNDRGSFAAGGSDRESRSGESSRGESSRGDASRGDHGPFSGRDRI
jgi:general stress protein YciG